MKRTCLGSVAAIGAAMLIWTSTVLASNCEVGGCGHEDFDGCGTTCASGPYSLLGWNDEPGMKFKVGRSVWEVGGWMEAGGYWNQYGSHGGNESPYGNPAKHGGHGNGKPFGGLQNGNLNMNQLGVHLGKEMHKEHGWDWGFRTDLLYGTDAWIAQTWRDANDEELTNRFDYHWGSGDYGLALPQLYGEVGYHELGVKFGRFYSVFDKGHLATDRFFYSRSLASVFEATTTQTGVVVDYELNHCWTVLGGWSGGFNTLENRFGDSFGFVGLEGKLAKDLHMKYVLGWGEYGHREHSHGTGKVFRQVMEFEWEMNHCWQYNFGWSLLNGAPEAAGYTSYGLNNELIYKLNHCWAYGLRGEWYREREEGSNIDFYQISYGVNWTPVKRLTIRPEIRYDWMNGGDEGEFGHEKTTQFSGGVSALMKF